MRKLLGLALLWALPAVALDVTGKWWGDAVSNGSGSRVYITLFQTGNTLAGTGGPSANEQDILQHGKVEGSRISFDILPAGRSPLHFELTPDGERLKGTMKAQHNGQTVTAVVSLRKRSN